MNNSDFHKFQLDSIRQGKQILADSIRLVIYKTLPDYFDTLDFEDDKLFLDPLLFAYANSSSGRVPEVLMQLLYGSVPREARPQTISVKAGPDGKIYLPNVGWIAGGQPGESYNLSEYMDQYSLNGQPVVVEPLCLGNKLGIELLPYKIELLSDRYFDVQHRVIAVEIDEPTKKFRRFFNNALDIIAQKIPWVSVLLQEGCFKAQIFDDGTDAQLNAHCSKNSFASFNVKGMSFHNVYQEWYDEIFFLDDIAHQMGHVIFDYMTTDKNRFYKVNHSHAISSTSEYGQIIDSIEKRSYEILFHALYTYYLILNVLDSCVDDPQFTEEQQLELRGRIAFYLRKCALDFEIFEPFSANEIAAQIFSTDGLYIYQEMKQSFSVICSKHGHLFTTCTMNNQAYNYNHRKFLEANTSLV